MSSHAEFFVQTAVTSDRSTTIRWIFSYVKKNWWALILVFVGAIGNASLASAVPIFIGQAFDAALETPANLPGIGWAAVGIIISQIVRAFLQLGRNFFSEVLGQRIERDAREELYVSLLGKSMSFHDSQSVGDTMARATNDVREMNLMFNPGVNLVVGSFFFLVVPMVVSPTYHPALVLAPAFYIVAYFLALSRYLRVLRPIADRVRLAFGNLNSRLAESLDGIEILKGSATEEDEVDLFSRNATTYREAVVDQGRVEARFLPLLLLGVSQALGLAHAIYLYQIGADISIGDIVAYMGLLALFGFPTFVSLFAYSQVARGMAGARRVLELITTESDLDENITGHIAPIRGEIEFQDVCFRYLKNKPVLKNISFTVKPGQTVAVVGQTGSGKSTLAKLINRTYDATTGRVLIDGRDVREWQLASLRQQISIIEQDIFLFSRSIADNIAFGREEATREMVEEAAETAQAHDFIENFKDKYDTIVGGRGVTLSGGQRQRIALARAFLTDPRILILDDSTSAVDSATEDKIQKAISKAAERQTTFLITHRLSQIRWADLVVVLRNGEIVAVGQHDELMDEVPAYRRIFEQYN
ncbi:MAG: ABC transporter ATP-binding protein [Ardenticatenaceae bacterium]|nr:ABC transporter ATP-binding protein [Ardenticatenaceae bacterium]